jgi:hypothetical protein
MINFTQYLLPNGRREPRTIDRPAEIEAIAQRFIDSGGKYECEVLRTGQVSLTAVKRVNGEEQDVAIVLCANEPDKIGPSVDKLVRESEPFIDGGLK